MKRALKAVFRRIIWFICWFFPINDRKIIFSSYYGRGYGDNPKYIAEELLNSENKYKLIWIVKSDKEEEFIPKGIIAVKGDTVRAIFHITTAKIWVDNCRKSFFYKKKKQYYIQTWHGFALKRIEKDVVDKLGKAYVRSAIQDSKAINLIVSDSGFMTDLYKSSFWYDGEIVEWGSPRNDVLIKEEKIANNRLEIQTYYDIPQNSKIILYAPTFRVDGTLEPYKIGIKNTIQAASKRFSSNFIVLVRLHPNISDKSSELNFEWGSDCIDVSKYPDIQTLLSAADMVISDYSSLMFDYALSGRPCFQYAVDIDEYKKDRDFYFKLDELPFDLATTNDELATNILEFNEQRYASRLESFFASVRMVVNGDSSKKCADFIEKICFEKGKNKHEKSYNIRNI